VGVEGGTAPSPENFCDFGSQNGDLWCILGAIFCRSAKTLRGEKILSPRYIFIGRVAIAPPGIDATDVVDSVQVLTCTDCMNIIAMSLN